MASPSGAGLDVYMLDKVNDIDKYFTMPRRPALEIPGTHHTGEETHIVREVMRAHQAIVTTFGRSVGAPAARLVLMRLLAIAEANLGTTDLARRLGVHPAAITRQLQDLERGGLVERCPDPRDGRRSAARLTPRGREAFREIHDRGHAFERELGASVSPDEVRTAVRVLAELRRVVLRALPSQAGEDEP